MCIVTALSSPWNNGFYCFDMLVKSSGRYHSLLHTMFDRLSHLELHFLDLASFATKIVGVCTIFTLVRPEIWDGDCFFLFMTYWGLHYNWDTHNAFVSGSRHEVKACLQKLKGGNTNATHFIVLRKCIRWWRVLGLAYWRFNMSPLPL